MLQWSRAREGAVTTTTSVYLLYLDLLQWSRAREGAVTRVAKREQTVEAIASMEPRP